MDEVPEAKTKKEQVVDWKILARRARRPTPWIALGVVAVVGFLVLEAYVWNPGTGMPSEITGFRFDAVYMLERDTTGNESTFVVSPWFSNGGTNALKDLRFVVYTIESSRRIATDVGETGIGDMPSRTTQNASIEFRLNNTRNYSIEILVLEGEYLIARGYGSVGWTYDHAWAIGDQYSLDSEPLRLLVGSEFTYDYPQR